MTNLVQRRMPTATLEIVEKNNALVRMNKAKAYRELQRRQGRLLHRVWTENIPVGQSYDSAVKQRASYSKSASLDHQQAMVESTPSTRSTLFNRKYPTITMFTSDSDSNRPRPLSRGRLTPASRCLYMEPGRPVTAPETNAYATIDGPRQETTLFPKANSVRSNASDTESLDRFKLQPHNRKSRQSIDLTVPTIDYNNNQPLRPRNQDDSGGGSIRYPTASKMRELLANDGKVSLEDVIAAEQGAKGIMKKSSQVSFVSRMVSTTQSQQESQTPANKSTSRPHNASTPSSIKRHQHISLHRKNSQNKQVSFLESGGDNCSQVKTTPTNISQGLPEEQQLLALTTKNLNMYNAMVLKTLRTSKFDERIVQWVKERQCDQRLRLPKHDVIPEVDEFQYKENSTPSRSRTTPNRADNNGSTTPTSHPSPLIDKVIDVKPTILSDMKTEQSSQPPAVNPETTEKTREDKSKPIEEMSVSAEEDGPS